MRTSLTFAVMAICAVSRAAEPGTFHIPETALAAEILAEWPELKDAQTDWERVNILRCWAWGATDFIHKRSAAKPDVDSRFHIGNPTPPAALMERQSAAQFYGQFKEGRGGVWILESAIGLAKLYREFGYTAGHVGIGGTIYLYPRYHAQTLVQISHKGQQLLVLQDPVFNLNFVDKMSREPLDYFEILRRLGRRNHTSILASSPDYLTMPKWPRMFYPDELIGGRTAEAIQRDCWPVLDDVYFAENVNGNFLYTSPRTLEKWLRCEAYDAVTGQPKLIAEIVTKGYPPDWLYLHLMPRGILTHTKLDDELNSRVASSISLGEGERIELNDEK